MKPSKNASLPDVLTIFPINSVVIWTNRMWSDQPRYVPGIVMGRCPGRWCDNARIYLRVLSIRNTRIGPVLYWIDKTSILIANVMTLAAFKDTDTWARMRREAPQTWAKWMEPEQLERMTKCQPITN
jgi:hypothetical protein